MWNKWLTFAIVCLTANCCFSKEPSILLDLQVAKFVIERTSESEYSLPLYQPQHKRWSTFLSGKISPDYDVFGNELKTNVFTTLGVDF
jgi:hypothetical protein